MGNKIKSVGSPKWFVVTVKVVLMVILFALLLYIPLSMREKVLDEFSVISSSAVDTNINGGNIFFNTIFQIFAGLLAAMLLINIIFFSVDERLNDSTLPRRVLQIILNVLIIVGGGLILWYQSAVRFPSLSWWQSILLSTRFEQRLAMLPAMIFLLCSTIQMIWDMWLFGPQNRAPWCRGFLR